MTKIPGIQHLAFVPYHLSYIDRIVSAVVGTNVIDAAGIFFLIGKLLQPRTTHQLFSAVGTNPDLSITDKSEYIRPVFFPPIYLTG